MPKIQMNIRVDEAVLKALKERANRENRTLSNLVETLLREAVLSPP